MLSTQMVNFEGGPQGTQGGSNNTAFGQMLPPPPQSSGTNTNNGQQDLNAVYFSPTGSEPSGGGVHDMAQAQAQTQPQPQGGTGAGGQPQQQDETRNVMPSTTSSPSYPTPTPSGTSLTPPCQSNPQNGTPTMTQRLSPSSTGTPTPTSTCPTSNTIPPSTFSPSVVRAVRGRQRAYSDSARALPPFHPLAQQQQQASSMPATPQNAGPFMDRSHPMHLFFPGQGLTPMPQAPPSGPGQPQQPPQNQQPPQPSPGMQGQSPKNTGMDTSYLQVRATQPPAPLPQAPPSNATVPSPVQQPQQQPANVQQKQSGQATAAAGTFLTSSCTITSTPLASSPTITRKRSSSTTQSPVWNHYAITPDGKRQCLHCQSLFSPNSSTSTLGRHLKRHRAAIEDGYIPGKRLKMEQGYLHQQQFGYPMGSPGMGMGLSPGLTATMGGPMPGFQPLPGQIPPHMDPNSMHHPHAHHQHPLAQPPHAQPHPHQYQQPQPEYQHPPSTTGMEQYATAAQGPPPGSLLPPHMAQQVRRPRSYSSPQRLRPQINGLVPGQPSTTS